MSRRRESFFATCPPGYERVLLEEVRALRLPRPEGQPGGVAFGGTIRDAARANLRLRTASRVLLRLDRVPAETADALHEGVGRIEWERFLRPEGTLAVQARGRNPALRNAQFTERRVKDAVVDRFRDRTGARPSVDLSDPDLRIHVRVQGERAVILADTSGAALFRRGWRRETGTAPLKETLAAFLVLSSGWDRRSPLLDPFCGSGTILVEAGLLAGNVAPGLFRDAFGFERWPGHDAKAWAEEKDRAREDASHPPKLILAGRDRDAAAIRRAEANLEGAGLSGKVRLDATGIGAFRPRSGWNAWTVTNPPYGERMGKVEKLRPIYRLFGDRLREHCGGYRLAMLSGNRALTRALGLEPESRIEVRNGPLECELVVLTVPR